MSKVFPSVIIGYYLGQRLPENLRPVLRSARTLDEVIATVTVSKLFENLSGSKDLLEAERRARESYYNILEELRSVTFGESRKIVELILDRHAIKRTRALIGAIERNIPPEDRKLCMAIGFLKPEALRVGSIEELREYIPEKYHKPTMYELLLAYREEALKASLSPKVKRMLERELSLRTLLLIIRSRINKDISQEVEKIAEVDPYATPTLVRRVAEAKDRKSVLDELAEHPFYEYIKDIDDPFEAFFQLHDKAPEIIGFKNVPVIPSPERIYSGLKLLEREVEKLVSIMNMVVV